MKFKFRKQNQKGFTLIELVILIIIVGIFVAALIPRFVDLRTRAQSATASAEKAIVQSALALYIAQNSDSYPTVTALAGYLQAGGSTVTASAGGIQFMVNGRHYTVATYTDTTCFSATMATSDTVRCVGPVSQ
ncbi:MAG: prepilin-type cleavage/methylation domain-containing protein [Gammaproteobacteria bacterium CG11_big_fil_rev_8_21_14_0_20_46_22]|nr:MAG: prepilin-type cleavage/methylation domain-containing protein [Gammaproteobacteria bacterium CG12_big_fil_rev_8_21_14_0_65_46_12]PIR11259.1 MAG: prepilin-type cleavage/methylation domain-containing protein [Gammaproteobacteria bacterium CG11_big_fil_rev_8_21_14_0_20_46_22]